VLDDAGERPRFFRNNRFLDKFGILNSASPFYEEGTGSWNPDDPFSTLLLNTE